MLWKNIAAENIGSNEELQRRVMTGKKIIEGSIGNLTISYSVDAARNGSLHTIAPHVFRQNHSFFLTRNYNSLKTAWGLLIYRPAQSH